MKRFLAVLAATCLASVMLLTGIASAQTYVPSGIPTDAQPNGDGDFFLSGFAPLQSLIIIQFDGGGNEIGRQKYTADANGNVGIDVAPETASISGIINGGPGDDTPFGPINISQPPAPAPGPAPSPDPGPSPDMSIAITDPYVCGGDITGDVDGAGPNTNVVVTLSQGGAVIATFTPTVANGGAYAVGAAELVGTPAGAYTVSATATDKDNGNTANVTYDIVLGHTAADCDPAPATPVPATPVPPQPPVPPVQPPAPVPVPVPVVAPVVVVPSAGIAGPIVTTTTASIAIPKQPTITPSSAAPLAHTGSEVATPLLLGGALIAVGGMAIVASKRREDLISS